jgi:sialic acid synthase SpsE
MTTSDFEMVLQWRNTFGCVPLVALGASIIEEHFTLDREGRP